MRSDKEPSWVEVVLEGAGKGAAWAGLTFVILLLLFKCAATVGADESHPLPVTISSIDDPSLDQAIIFGVKRDEPHVVVVEAVDLFDNHKYLLLLQERINQRMSEDPEHAHYYLEAKQRVEEGLKE